MRQVVIKADFIPADIWIKPPQWDGEVTGSFNCVITASSVLSTLILFHRMIRVYCTCRFVLAGGSESSIALLTDSCCLSLGVSCCSIRKRCCHSAPGTTEKTCSGCGGLIFTWTADLSSCDWSWTEPEEEEKSRWCSLNVSKWIWFPKKCSLFAQVKI